jgi:predicted dehydrogenase
MKILVIGRGYQGTKIYEMLARDFFNKGEKVIIENTGRGYNIFLKNNIYDKIIIATTPKTHSSILLNCLSKSNADIYIEKPLYTQHDNVIDIILKNDMYNKRIMVGNKFLYSPSLFCLRMCLSDTNINGIFGRWVKSKPCKDYGIFFDILYHHLNICLYLSNDNNICINNKIDFTNSDTNYPKSGIITGEIDTYIPFVLEGTCKNLYDKFDNSLRIETDKGTFIIQEIDNKLKVLSNDATFSDGKESLYYSLEYFLENDDFIGIYNDVKICEELLK